MTTARRVPDDELEYDENLIYLWRGQLFTGIAFERGPAGIVSEVSYIDGSQQGPARDVSPEGQLLSEDTYFQNSRHGVSRVFDSHGRVTHAAWYEYNFLMRSADLDRSGALVWRDHVLPESAEAKLLERWKRELDWPAPGSSTLD